MFRSTTPDQLVIYFKTISTCPEVRSPFHEVPMFSFSMSEKGFSSEWCGGVAGLSGSIAFSL